jgi:hypothetical protein
MLRMSAMIFKCFSGVFVTVLDACFNYFICLQTYIASVASGCFKSRLGVANVMRMGSGRGGEWSLHERAVGARNSGVGGGMLVPVGTCWHGRGVLVRAANELARATYHPTDGYLNGRPGTSISACIMYTKYYHL